MRKLLSDDVRVKSWTRSLDPGDVLFQEGEPGKTLFLVMEGRVEVLRGGERVSEVDLDEAFVGEMASLTGQPRSATIRALTPCTFVAVEDAAELLAIDPSIGLKLAQVLARRLRRVEHNLDLLKQHAVEANDAETVRIVTQIVNSLAVALRPDSDEDTIEI